MCGEKDTTKLQGICCNLVKDLGEWLKNGQRKCENANKNKYLHARHNSYEMQSQSNLEKMTT